MDVVRRVWLLSTAGLLGVALMLGRLGERPAPPPASNDARSLANAASYFDSTIVLARAASPRAARGDELTIALGYLERLRLGLGSPYRLVDEAARDPRLDPRMNVRVARAVIARLERGDAYTIDPSVLDGAGPWGVDGHGATGASHLELIDRAIGTATDPRAGELAVRLAYSIAAAKGVIASSSVATAAQVAALMRDRQLAVADLRDLLTAAAARRIDVVDLVSQRRAAHMFRVEQPPLAPLGADLQLEAMNDVPALVRALDTLDRVRPSPAAEDAARAPWPVLGHEFAARLSALAQDQPPVAQVAVTLRGYPDVALDAWNDESLAAAYASLSAQSDSGRRRDALALLSTAVALRSVAQQSPWFPGDDGPDPSDLAAEFGIASVTFARAVPVEWQPYYLRELQDGLRDMRRVFPSFALDGLHIRFGVDALRDSALAMHDPRTRTIQLSIETSGGTFAHELSHDLDWQAARRLFAGGGGYSTDRSVSERRGPLARSVRGLAEARLLRPAGPGATPAVDRPAELFARGADWFVASSLARQGITDGFLSAIEDASLAGYAAGPPTAIGAAGVRSLTSAIEEMTYLPDSIRAAFESQWSDPRLIDPLLLVRRALDTPMSWRAAWQSRSPIGLPQYAAQPQLCTADDSPSFRARQHLLSMAIDARAHGMVARRARGRSAAARPGWANSVLGVAPWSPEEGDQMVGRLRSALAAELTSALSDQGVVPGVPAIFFSSALSCSAIAR